MKDYKGMVGKAGKMAAAAMGHTSKEHAAMMAKPKKKAKTRGSRGPLKGFDKY